MLNPQRTVRARPAGEDWCVRADFRERLLGSDAPDWFVLQAQGGARLVKRGYGRTTWRVTLGDRTVYVKLCRIPGLADRLKQLVLGSPVEREWRKTRQVEGLDVPVVRPLAVGVRTGRPTRCALITEELPRAMDLVQTWERQVASLPVDRRRSAALDVIEPVARLVALGHERGFVHRDAHPGNILMSRSSDGRLQAIWGDVHGARVSGKPAPLRLAVRSLAQIDQYFQHRAGRTERLRFLRSYLSRRAELRGVEWSALSERAVLAELRKASRSHQERLARQRDRRLCRSGKYFSSFGIGGGWRVTAVLKLERRHVFPEPGVADRTEVQWRELLGPLLASIDPKAARSSTAMGGRPVLDGIHVEVLRAASFWQRLSWTLTASHHRRVFEVSHKVRHRDGYCSLMLGVAEHRSGGLIDCTVLLAVEEVNPRTGARESDGGAYT